MSLDTALLRKAGKIVAGVQGDFEDVLAALRAQLTPDEWRELQDATVFGVVSLLTIRDVIEIVQATQE